LTPAYSEGVGFVDVVRQHGGPLMRFAMRLVGSSADAEEIVQEALMRAYADRMKRARTRRELAASVYRITHNLSVDHLRRRRLRLLDREVIACRADMRARSPERIYELGALRTAVRRAVEELPEGYRDVVSLRFGLGLTYRAIARELKLSVPAVEARLHRAKDRLRKALAPWAGLAWRPKTDEAAAAEVERERLARRRRLAVARRRRAAAEKKKQSQTT
jgi:RNA polymerase sigma-70 factor (ECF subfamily)